MDIDPRVISGIALLFSFCSAIVSVLTFRRNGPDILLKQQRIGAMRKLCSAALISWENAQLFAGLLSDEGIDPDPYLFIAAQANTRRLDSCLDNAIEAGLDPELIGDFPHSRELFVAFRGAVSEVLEIDEPRNSSIEDFTKMHYVMGLTRLIDSCVHYKEADLIIPREREKITKKVSSLRDTARTYILGGASD